MAASALAQVSAGWKARLPRLLGRATLALVLVAGLGLLLLALAGFFRSKIGPERIRLPEKPAGELPLAEVRLIRRPRFETAVGTVRPVHEAAVASKLLAKVVEVRVKAGQAVSRNEILVRLDDADLRARLQQAQAALSAAQSAYQQALADYKRAQQLLEGRAIARAEYEKFETQHRTAAAELERAKQAVHEAQVLLDYATLRAPMTGIIIEKRVDVGDTVVPGQILLTLYDPTRMQMVVTVREALAQRLRVGQQIRARLEALNYDCLGTVSEIVPEAHVASRAFTIKVTGPCPPGVFSGMFGRIFIPLEDEEVLVVPASAVIKVGQLDMVDVLVDGTPRRRSVQLGRKLEHDYEVLAGLAVGEKVLLRPSLRTSHEQHNFQ